MKTTIQPTNDSLADHGAPEVELDVRPEENEVEFVFPSKYIYYDGEHIETQHRAVTFNLSELQHLLNYKG